MQVNNFSPWEKRGGGQINNGKFKPLNAESEQRVELPQSLLVDKKTKQIGLGNFNPLRAEAAKDPIVINVPPRARQNISPNIPQAENNKKAANFLQKLSQGAKNILEKLSPSPTDNKLEEGLLQENLAVSEKPLILPNRVQRRAIRLKEPHVANPEAIESSLPETRRKLAKQAKEQIQAKMTSQKGIVIKKLHTYEKGSAVQKQLQNQLAGQRFTAIMKEIEEFNKTEGMSGEIAKNIKSGKNEFQIKGEVFIFKPNGKLYVKVRELGKGAFKVPVGAVLIASAKEGYLNKKQVGQNVGDRQQEPPELKERAYNPVLAENEAVINQFLKLMEKAGFDLSESINIAKNITYVSANGNKQLSSTAPLAKGKIENFFSSLNDQEILYVGWKMAEAVAKMHDTAAIVHRDLKPDNFLFSRDNKGQIQVKINDFGLSTFTDEGIEKNPIVGLGPGAYMAPELFFSEKSKENYDFSTDVYQLTISIMHTMLRLNMSQFVDQLENDVKEWGANPKAYKWEKDEKIEKNIKSWLRDNPLHSATPQYIWKHNIQNSFIVRNFSQQFPELSKRLLPGLLNIEARPTARQVANYMKAQYIARYKTDRSPLPAPPSLPPAQQKPVIKGPIQGEQPKKVSPIAPQAKSHPPKPTQPKEPSTSVKERMKRFQ